MEISIQNRHEELPRVHQCLQDFVQRHELPANVLFATDLALEEWLTNVVSYGFEDGKDHTVKVRFSIEDATFLIEVEDDGRAFNLLEHPPVDISVPLDQKPVGGLGIHLIRQFIDQLEYQRVQDRNILTLRKRIESSDPLKK